MQHTGALAFTTLSTNPLAGFVIRRTYNLRIYSRKYIRRDADGLSNHESIDKESVVLKVTGQGECLAAQLSNRKREGKKYYQQ